MASQPRRPFLTSTTAKVQADVNRLITTNCFPDTIEAATGNHACDNETMVTMAGSRSGAQPANERDVR
jgi:hypothetical protein